jgi:hypothetical protein
VKTARVTIDSCPVGFVTECAAAFERLEWMLETTFRDAFYRFTVTPTVSAERIPTLRYVDDTAWQTEYLPESGICTFTAPWPDIEETTVLAMWLFYLSELVRQRRGEYLVHASAVVRDGKTIVLFGPSESGKTITSLDLCLTHGFQLFANNRVRVGLRDGAPRLLHGDPSFNLRGSSLRMYSEALAAKFFDDGAASRPKRRVDPSELGIDVAAPDLPVSVFVLLALDERGPRAPAARIPPDIRSRGAFRAVAAVYDEISNRIRGTGFVPIALGPRSEEFFVPSLDTREFVRSRMRFLEALFASTTMLKVRAPLDHTVAELLRAL